MADHSKPQSSHDLFQLLGFGTIRKAYKAFISKRNPDRNNSSNNSSQSKKWTSENKTKGRSIKDRFKGVKDENRNAEAVRSDTNKKFDEFMSRSPQQKPRFSRTMSMSPLLRSTSNVVNKLRRSTSNISQTAVPPTKSSLLDRRNSIGSSSTNQQPTLSRNLSTKGSNTILFTNSSGLLKPPAMEMQLDCTLEELCFGSLKKVRITRDTVTYNGQIIAEEEVLAIKVTPGWNKGTKITFEKKGNEMPGAERGDVIFVVAEKEHQVFKREGDDLELGVEIPLVEALTGSTIPVPLLGGTKMSLEVDEIIYPGYEKIIAGQGMPKQNEPGARGDLKVTFLVEFPGELTQEQRFNVVNLLQDTIYS